MSKLCIVNHVADHALSTSESGKVNTNRFATQDITFTLPSDATEGTCFYIVSVEHSLTVTIDLENLSHQITTILSTSVGQSIISDISGEDSAITFMVFDGTSRWLSSPTSGNWDNV